MTTITIRYRSDLTHVQRSILDYLELHTPRRWSHCLLSARKIASAVGCSLRTVGLAVKRFAVLGLVRLVSGGLLASLRDALGWRPSIRRALELTWRQGAFLSCRTPPNERANASCSTDLGFAPSIDLPPDPPIEASDDPKKEETEDGGGRDHFESAETPPPPQEVSPPPWKPEPNLERNTERTAPRKATAEELARLDRAAAKITKDPAFPQRLRNLARARGLRRVLVATEIVVEKSEADEIRNPFGFVLGVLRTFDEDGIVPELGEDPEARSERAWANIFGVLKT